MPRILHQDLQNDLKKIIVKARQVAESGATSAIRELCVAETREPKFLSEDQLNLRNHLRERARLLGDQLERQKSTELRHLIHEIAYAHWHRTLFSKLLLENDLLVDTRANFTKVNGVEISEIAEDEGKSFTEVAAEYAQPMLPEIFQKDDPILQLSLPPETIQKLNELVDEIPTQTFKADDTLGWIYQFWQASKKRNINENKLDVGADELPPVTQLFTEAYMVQFLLENTIGSWWVGKKLANDPELANCTCSEDELRRKLSLPGYDWAYLRLHKNDSNQWQPTSNTFSSWPKKISELTILDPCMGSGHFLVFALSILIPIRMVEDKLDVYGAIEAVLRENLFGLEIDPRCTQIAVFAIAIASWKRIGCVKPLPKLNIACTGLEIGNNKEKFLDCAEILDELSENCALDNFSEQNEEEKDRLLDRMHNSISRLYDTFTKAPILGSLIDPQRELNYVGSLFEVDYKKLAKSFETALSSNESNYDLKEIAVTAQGLAKAADYLTRKFTLIATNVPFIGYRKLSSEFQEYLKTNFEDEKEDLATCMIERFRVNQSAKSIAVVSPRSWLYKPKFSKFRKKILEQTEIKLMVIIGDRGFRSSEAAGASVSLLISELNKINTNPIIAHTDVSNCSSPSEKAKSLKENNVEFIPQNTQLENMENRISLNLFGIQETLGDYIFYNQGIKTGDDNYWVRWFWEVESIGEHWVAYQNPPSGNIDFDGRSQIINWSTNGSGMTRPRVQSNVIGCCGVVVGSLGKIYVTLYTGERFSSAATPVIPVDPQNLVAIYCFFQSENFNKILREIEPDRNVTTGTFAKLPFNLNEWKKVATVKYPNGLPNPITNDPTQWLFDGNPFGTQSTNSENTGLKNRSSKNLLPLQVGVARLLGYLWPRQSGVDFPDCANISKLDEISSKNLTVKDGILSIIPLNRNPSGPEQLLNILQASKGSEWNENIVRQCLETESSATDLDSWFRNNFFKEHCLHFRNTPFIWHIWDGEKSGFSALINYHKLCAHNGNGRRLLEKLRDTYLGEWINRLRKILSDGDDTAESLIASAEHLKDELDKIIVGEPPYDIFVRWKPLHEQPIGWEPDINDGVRVNIRPFLNARTIKKANGKSFPILRYTPKIRSHDKKDQGKEFGDLLTKEKFPWFWAEKDDAKIIDFGGGEVFFGHRFNNFHYTNETKNKSRNDNLNI